MGFKKKLLQLGQILKFTLLEFGKRGGHIFKSILKQLIQNFFLKVQYVKGGY